MAEKLGDNEKVHAVGNERTRVVMPQAVKRAEAGGEPRPLPYFLKRVFYVRPPAAIPAGKDVFAFRPSAGLEEFTNRTRKRNEKILFGFRLANLDKFAVFVIVLDWNCVVF
jgi:hypothetical protein